MNDPAADAPAAALARVRVVLVRTSHPGNIGAAARAMLTMGLGRLVLVEPRRFPDPEADALATGATGILAAAEVVRTLPEALVGASCSVGLTARPRALVGRALSVRAAAREAVAHAARTPASEAALVFGTEMSGLSNEELAQCSVAATIPANADYPSLNLAAAVQVACYEVRCAAAGAEVEAAPRFPAATHDEIEALYAHAARTLTDLKFLDPRLPRQLLPRLRRLFARAGLEKEEVNILRGILVRVDQRIAQARGRVVGDDTA